MESFPWKTPEKKEKKEREVFSPRKYNEHVRLWDNCCRSWVEYFPEMQIVGQTTY